MNDTHTKLSKYLAEIYATPFMGDDKGRDSCAHTIAYYRQRARYKRRAFRTASVILILLGAALPVVAAFGDRLPYGLDKNVIVGLMSAMIAFLTGLSAHFRWEVGWRSQTEAMLAIKAEKAAWETAVALAKALPDEEQAIAYLAERFEQFRVRTFEISRSERTKIFKASEPAAVNPPPPPAPTDS